MQLIEYFSLSENWGLTGGKCLLPIADINYPVII
jgi:hypothetical protein